MPTLLCRPVGHPDNPQLNQYKFLSGTIAALGEFQAHLEHRAFSTVAALSIQHYWSTDHSPCSDHLESIFILSVI